MTVVVYELHSPRLNKRAQRTLELSGLSQVVGLRSRKDRCADKEGLCGITC